MKIRTIGLPSPCREQLRLGGVSGGRSSHIRWNSHPVGCVTALGAVVRYSPKDPPKSPPSASSGQALERGTSTAPLSKGGWGDRNVPHNSENCCNNAPEMN